MGSHPPPSSITCQDITVPMGFCSLVFHPTPAIHLLLEHVFFFLSFFLKVSTEFPLKLLTSICVLILSLLGTYLVQLPTAGFIQIEKQTRCRMRSSGSWIWAHRDHCSELHQPHPPFWILDSFHSWTHSTLPHVGPFTDPTVKTLTWHKWCLPGQPSWSLATPWLTSTTNVI